MPKLAFKLSNHVFKFYEMNPCFFELKQFSFQVLKGRDVIAQAQSGTGKTATFSISILQSIDTTVRETQVRS